VLAQTSKLPQDASFEPHFYCPKCHTQRPYEKKPDTKDFIFFSMPRSEARKLDEFVVCQVCKKGFDLNILRPSNQSLFKLVGATRQELLYRSSPGALKLRLMSDGLNEVVVDQLISLAQH
jgi:hypothetical protein